MKFRMWMVPARHLCQSHLAEEHTQIHELAGHLNRGKQVDSYIANNGLEPQSIRERHEALAKELSKRKTGHNSHLPEIIKVSHLPPEVRAYKVDTEASLMALLKRCMMCRDRYLREYRKKEE